MRVLVCVLLSWTTSLGKSCGCLENVTTVTAVEVYQKIHLIPVNTTNNSVIEVDLLTNSVKLPSGMSCEYFSGSCYDAKSNQNYTWEVSRDFPEGNLICSDLARFWGNGNYTFSILTLRQDPLVKFLVGESSTSIYSLQLVKEEPFCGKKIWITDQENLIVAFGEENFINGVNQSKNAFPIEAVGVTIYNIERKCDLYYSMTSKCDNQSYATQKELELYKNEVAQLQTTVATLQITVDSMQKKLQEYQEENYGLKKDYNEAVEMVPMRASSQKDSLEDLPRTFSNVFEGIKNCPNFILFPYENVFCIVVAVLYVSISVINTITNYFSLRMLRNKKQKCFVFYALTQGFTTLYVSKCLSLTKRRIDKWLLDLE